MAKPEPDTTITIRQSLAKMLGLIILAIGMTALGFVLAWPSVAGSELGYFGQLMGWIAFVFFGGCTILISWRALTLRGPVVAISPDGVRDVRVAADTIPWSAIEDIYTWQTYGQKIVILQIPDAEWDRLKLTSIARRSRSANRALGADGIAISAQGLTIGPDRLYELIAEMAAKHAPASATKTV